MVLCPADETNNVLAEVTPCESCCQLLNSPFGAIPVNSLVAGCPSLAREISITPWLIRISFCSELTPASQWFIASNPFLSFRIISHFLILPRHCSEGFMTFLLGVKTPLLPGVISVISIIHCCKLDLLKVSKTNQAKMVTHIEMIRNVSLPLYFRKKDGTFISSAYALHFSMADNLGNVFTTPIKGNCPHILFTGRGCQLSKSTKLRIFIQCCQFRILSHVQDCFLVTSFTFVSEFAKGYVENEKNSGAFSNLPTIPHFCSTICKPVECRRLV